MLTLLLIAAACILVLGHCVRGQCPSGQYSLGYYPDLTNCNGYYQCVNGAQVQYSNCPPNLYWSVTTTGAGFCNQAQLVTCNMPSSGGTGNQQLQPIGQNQQNGRTGSCPNGGSNQIGQPGQPNQVGQPGQPYTSVSGSFTCPSQPSLTQTSANGYYGLNCDRYFYLCVSGQPFRYVCPTGMYWSIIEMTCDFQYRLTNSCNFFSSATNNKMTLSSLTFLLVVAVGLLWKNLLG